MRDPLGLLSKTSKMPGYSTSLPPWSCKTGMRLRKKGLVKGCETVCSRCYGCKGHYHYPVVQAALERRYMAIFQEWWVGYMVEQISGESYFRWHDVGDVQDPAHLRKIFEVCRRTKSTKHWLPTKETWAAARAGAAPENLTIRLSAHLVDEDPSARWGKMTLLGRTNYSAVHTKKPIGKKCRAKLGKCGTCRMCWDKNVKCVSYPLR